MSEHPILALMLEQNSFLGSSTNMEDDIMPIQAQLDFGPGDVAMLGASQCPAERDFALVQCLNAEDYAETFPDWQERVEVRDYVLCTHFSRADREISIGWFSRLKLMPIDYEHYEEALGWIATGFPEDAPDWVNQYWRTYADELNKLAPDKVPSSVTCEICGSHEVGLEITRKSEYKGRAGRVVVDGHEIFIPITDPDETHTQVGQLVCADCHATAKLDESSWRLPE